MPEITQISGFLFSYLANLALDLMPGLSYTLDMRKAIDDNDQIVAEAVLNIAHQKAILGRAWSKLNGKISDSIISSAMNDSVFYSEAVSAELKIRLVRIKIAMAELVKLVDSASEIA